MHQAIECVFESESKVGSNKRDQGGSETQNDHTTRGLLEQALRFAHKTGIRLLPGSDFSFTDKDRRTLIDHLNKFSDGIDPFLDTVEELAREYCTHIRQRQGATTPVELKEKLQSIKKHAVGILRNFNSLGVLKDEYSAGGEDTKTLLYFEVKDYTSDSQIFIKRVIGDLTALIQAIDSATSGDIESLESERDRINSKRFPVRVARAFGLSLKKKYRKKATPVRGRPKKEAEVKLIKNIALAHEHHFGELPPKAPEGYFIDFITDLFYLITPESPQSDYGRLVKTALTDL